MKQQDSIRLSLSPNDDITTSYSPDVTLTQCRLDLGWIKLLMSAVSVPRMILVRISVTKTLRRRPFLLLHPASLNQPNVHLQSWSRASQPSEVSCLNLTHS